MAAQPQVQCLGLWPERHWEWGQGPGPWGQGSRNGDRDLGMGTGIWALGTGIWALGTPIWAWGKRSRSPALANNGTMIPDLGDTRTTILGLGCHWNTDPCAWLALEQ